MKQRFSKQEYKELLSKFRSGERKVDIAKRLGISRELARQAVMKAERIERIEASENKLDTLSTRVRNCLESVNVYDVDGLRKLIDSGAIKNINQLGAVGQNEAMMLIRSIDSGLESS